MGIRLIKECCSSMNNAARNPIHAFRLSPAQCGVQAGWFSDNDG